MSKNQKFTIEQLELYPEGAVYAQAVREGTMSLQEAAIEVLNHSKNVQTTASTIAGYMNKVRAEK